MVLPGGYPRSWPKAGIIATVMEYIEVGATKRVNRAPDWSANEKHFAGLKIFNPLRG
jgi:hypothetical protein